MFRLGVRISRGFGHAQPEGYGQSRLFFQPGRWQELMLLQCEAGAAEPAADLLCGDSEAAMGVFAAQGFELMGGEINNQQPALGMKNAAGLEQGAGWIIKIVQNLVDDDEIC